MEDLLKYAKQDRRVCPQPQKWNELWKMLPGKVQKGAGWKPPLPLILAAWWNTSDEQKRQRLEEHIRYATDKGALEQVEQFLKGLNQNEWHYEED